MPVKHHESLLLHMTAWLYRSHSKTKCSIVTTRKSIFCSRVHTTGLNVIKCSTFLLASY